jgi:hypothetical protein
MQNTGYNDPMPSDKLMRLFIIQAISSFVAGDHESGLHYLNEIKQTYAQHMMNLNPTLKSLAKEIIQSLDLFSPGSSATDLSNAVPASDLPSHDSMQPVTNTGFEEQPTSVTSELQDLLNRRRAKRNK